MLCLAFVYVGDSIVIVVEASAMHVNFFIILSNAIVSDIKSIKTVYMPQLSIIDKLLGIGFDEYILISIIFKLSLINIVNFKGI